ncbi:MAG TPA: sigma factor-like helix-turn-helix DNA-binding protein [Candidatus Nanoarchaeia archaeon]|nr:sigma factor-like helix-turn-helix DNA-binding protein [Candidatus Nanoarchaeia archaeon]
MFDYFRRQSSQSLADKLIRIDEEGSSQVSTPEQEVSSNEVVPLLREYIRGSLRKADREALELSAQGYSPREVSTRLGISEEAARQRLCRARREINTYLKQLSSQDLQDLPTP